MQEPGAAAVDGLQLAFRFAAALGLGVMLGLERERTKTQEQFAGVRTFALIALSGGVAGFVDGFLRLPGLALGVFAAVAGLVLVSYAVSAQHGEHGITTEVSALLAFLIGWLCLRDQIQLAAALAVANAGLLALKDWLHRLARRIESTDVEATLKFALVTLIILPLVPNQNFGPPPLDVINPYKIWLMVVLISGLNFASYLLVKLVGAEHGLVLTGLLGGLVSSTAVTLGFSQRSLQHPGESSPLALGILVAWTVMFVRVVIVVGIVARAVAIGLAPGVAVLLVPSLVACFILWRRQRPAERATVSAGQNPFELMEAIRFGLLFGVVTFAAKAAEVYLGTAGLYLAGAVTGLTDVDAIALSMANLASGGGASVDVAARTVMIAVMSNTMVKALMAGFLGAPALRRIILPAAAAILAAGGVGMFLV